MAHADVVDDQRHARPHVPDLLPPIRPHRPDRGDPACHRERHGRRLRRGQLRRRALDPGRSLHGTGPGVAGRLAQIDDEQHESDDDPGTVQRGLERDGQGGRLVD